MAKPPLFGPNNSFITWTPPRRGVRSGILNLGRVVSGPTFMRQEAPDRLTSEDQLPTILASRFEATVVKLMFTAAQLFVEGHWHAPLAVEGAVVQQGQGNATRRRDGNKVYIAGTEAAHFGVGTIKRQGDALSVDAARQVVLWRRTSGYAEDDPRAAFEANGMIAGFGLDADGSTFLEPGFMNQADGIQERTKHGLIQGLIPRVVPASPEQLEGIIASGATQLLERLVSDQVAVLDPLTARLMFLSLGSADSEFRQDPNDTGNLLFGGSERQYLERVLSLHTDGSSELHGEVEQVARLIPMAAEAIAELAESARAERVQAPTYEPTPPEGGGGNGQAGGSGASG